MSYVLKYLRHQLNSFISFFGLAWGYGKDCVRFWQSNQQDGRFSLTFGNQYPCLYDKTSDMPYEPHYMYHPAWAARVVRKLKPKKHIDISSTLMFSAMLSAFVPTEYYDYRPANIRLPQLKSLPGDLLHLPFTSNSVESLSCMHTVEHIGLGRYGDPIDAQGDVKAILELQRVVRKGGSLIFVTPVGKSQLRFNAHRVYAYSYIMSLFKGWKLCEFALVPDDVWEKGLINPATKAMADRQSWGCGCFWFEKVKV